VIRDTFEKYLPPLLANRIRRAIDGVTDARLLGLRGAVDYWLASWASRSGRVDGLWRIHVKGWPGGVAGRYGTSDLGVFRQIFIRQEHAWAKSLIGSVAGGLILDCGANVGYTTVYLLRLFPGARVIAVEPDSSNFKLLELNLTACRQRVSAINAGVWSRETRLVCGNFGDVDLQHWGRQVRECDAGTPESIAAVTIGGLLAESGCERLALLKMDIEGAEVVVFGEGCQGWLGRTDAMAIELHDTTAFGPATAIFHEAIASHDFVVSSGGELTIAVRPQRGRHPQEQVQGS
jgi:FkbM family methyltransferase